MAKKSKTQRAKASAARAARKEQARQEEIAAAEAKKNAAEATATEAPKKRLFKKTEKTEASAGDGKQAKIQKAPEKKVEKAPEKKPKKRRFGFLKDVRLEMKRVTWPTKQDVLRWSVVVVVALLFFGVYVALLDNVVITPLLVAISGLGA
ncbi:preprotein translocase subunit SecE [Arabiibacter massiliensis]|uniref:preprotein translocase subunit SecE n=1 Tax=Arabiibacter massiliensis TaxID=1870985 RepID=UPI0009B9DF54|nr:preprotein translocase subunit SecE [Arabiibacter massiliensis]